MLKVDTKGYQGSVHKSADVFTNDPGQPQVKLNVLALVDVPLSVEPKGVMLGGAAGDEIQRVVVIKGLRDKPLVLEPGKNSLPDKMAFDLKKSDDGKEYRLTVRNLSKVVEDKYNGTITLKTNYPDQPEITIQCLGYIWKPGTEVPSAEELNHDHSGAGK